MEFRIRRMGKTAGLTSNRVTLLSFALWSLGASSFLDSLSAKSRSKRRQDVKTGDADGLGLHTHPGAFNQRKARTIPSPDQSASVDPASAKPAARPGGLYRKTISCRPGRGSAITCCQWLPRSTVEALASTVADQPGIQVLPITSRPGASVRT